MCLDTPGGLSEGVPHERAIHVSKAMLLLVLMTHDRMSLRRLSPHRMPPVIIHVCVRNLFGDRDNPFGPHRQPISLSTQHARSPHLSTLPGHVDVPPPPHRPSPSLKSHTYHTNPMPFLPILSSRSLRPSPARPSTRTRLSAPSIDTREYLITTLRWDPRTGPGTGGGN